MFPLEQSSRLELVCSHLKYTTIRIARVSGRRRRPEGEFRDDLVLSRGDVWQDRRVELYHVLPDQLRLSA